MMVRYYARAGRAFDWSTGAPVCFVDLVAGEGPDPVAIVLPDGTRRAVLPPRDDPHRPTLDALRGSKE